MYVITTMKDYNALSPNEKKNFRDNEVKKQDGKCLLCDEPFPKSLVSATMPVVDHDHKTDRIRGMLHSQCNMNLQVIEGHLEDDWIEKARDYISKY